MDGFDTKDSYNISLTNFVYQGMFDNKTISEALPGLTTWVEQEAMMPLPSNQDPTILFQNVRIDEGHITLQIANCDVLGHCVRWQRGGLFSAERFR